MKLIKYIAAAALALASTSCMDLEPKAEMGDNMVWDSAENFQLFANQFYGWTADLGRFANDNPHSEYRSDLLCSRTVNPYSQGTNVAPASDKDNYNAFYKRIYYTNLLLKNAAAFGNQEAIKVPVAEAKFFRAYCHFELVQRYGDVILLTEPLDIDSEKLYGPRDDRGTVIDQCIKDLREAAGGLPPTATKEGLLCADAAWAMLSRIALYEGTWQKFHNGGPTSVSTDQRAAKLLTEARDAAKKVIDNNNFELFYSPVLGNQSYRYMFILVDVQCNPAGLTKKDNKEYILSHRRRLGDKFAQNITHALLTSGDVIMGTAKLADMFLCDDGLPIDKSARFQGYSQPTSEYMNRDARMCNILLKHGTKYWDNDSRWRTAWNETDEEGEKAFTANAVGGSGYHLYKWASEREVEDYFESYDFPVIRYAEVLLNYAEAAFELDNQISDQDLNISLNLVRNRINPNMPKLSNTFANTHGLSMREEIRRERTIELFLEGFRIDDLKRWATASEEMSQDQLGVKVRGTWFESNWAAANGKLNADGRLVMYNDRGAWKTGKKLYLYPLPSDQRQLNPQLGQNPEW